MQIFAAVILILVTRICLAGEYEDYMDETFALISMGENEEALERFIWFHNNGVAQGLTTNPSRLSFGLMYWVDFGNKYPPALDALKRIRDKNTSDILKDDNSCDLFSEVEAINSNLSEDLKTIELFKRIDKDQPLLAKRCWIYFKELAIDNKLEYFIDKYIHDLKGEYDKTESRFITTMSFLSTDAENYADLISVTKDGFSSDVLKLLNLANSSNNTEASRYIQSNYDSVAKEYSTLNALGKH